MSVFSSISNTVSKAITKANGLVAGYDKLAYNSNISTSGVKRTSGQSTEYTSPIGLIGRNKNREPAGFTPDNQYVTTAGPLSKALNDNDSWYGSLLESHPDYTGKSNFYRYRTNKGVTKDLSSSERFDQSKNFPSFKDDLPDAYRQYSTRDYYLLFNDTSTDYFKHGLHVIDGKTPLRSDKNTREAWDGHEEGTPLRLDNVLRDKTGMGGSPYENTDPVLFGFEVVIDAISSPLLNGSVEDFITQFSSISEVGARKYVLSDFKQQFIKIFKTRGSVFIDQTANSQPKTSITTTNYSNTDSQSNIFQPGKKAYMSYYLKKVNGLELLMESNSPNKKKYLTKYREDILKLTFNEDVSSSLGTLAHLYKLLYWSKANGKHVIPDNLLRFNCDIIVSEVRNLNRVRRAVDTANLEVIKENVSRYIYSLKECQFYFDQPPHDSEIDLSQPTKEFDQFVVSMDYKYVTSKFERWVPDGQGFGTYVGYNNGAIWKVGNAGSRGNTSTVNAGTVDDNSVPKFFTTGLNSLKHNGVKAPITVETYLTYGSNEPLSAKNPLSTGPSNTGDGTEGSNETSADVKGGRSPQKKSSLDTFKENSKKAAKNLAKNLETAVKRELQTQVNIRLRLLNDTLDKIRNAAGVGRLREPTNVYKVPYYYEVGGIPVSTNLFFDVRNSLRDFAGDVVGDALGAKTLGNILKGGNNTGLFGK